MVRVTGLEPAHRLTPEPKSGASANSATPAYLLTFISCDNVVCLRKFTNFRISSISQIIDLECHLNSATPAYLISCCNKLSYLICATCIFYTISKKKSSCFLNYFRKNSGTAFAVPFMLTYYVNIFIRLDQKRLKLLC